MAAAVPGNDAWKADIELRDDLEKYVKQNLKRKEILDFASCKYPYYAWKSANLMSSSELF